MLAKNIQKVRKELRKRWEGERPNITPVRFVNIDGIDIAIKDESQNVTDTYKAKHGWMMGRHYIENVFPNPFIYYLGSTGNAGIADFAFADRLNEMLGDERVIVANFYPLHYDEKILGPDSFGRFTDGKKIREAMEQSKSGRLIQVDFTKKYWFGEPCIREMENQGIIATPENSLDITEGVPPRTYDQVMQEFKEQIRARYRNIPRTLAVIQFGAGMLYEDSKVVAQGEPIDFMAVSTGDRKTIADKICDSSESWQENLVDLSQRGFTRAKKGSRDRIYAVSEQEILYALAQFRELGIDAEPSGAAGMAIVPRVNEIIRRHYDLIAIINTGNGIKKCAYDSLVG